MKPYTKKELDFIKYVKARCKEHDVKCLLPNVKSVSLAKSVRCSGYFDESVPVLCSSMNRPDWIEILAHEYSHLTQWVERIPLWVEAERSLPFVWEWLEGVDCNDIDSHINIARDLELDNEKRAVKIIQTFNLDVDINHYIRKANGYVAMYNYIKLTRKWCSPKNSPYRNVNIINAMSDKFNMDHSKLSQKSLKVFTKEGI